MHAIEHTYISLLADVARLSGFSEIRGSYNGLHWCLNEAPKLEKMVLDSIETGVKLDLDRFPVPLRRLAAASVSDAVQLRYLRQLLLFSYKAYVTHDTQTTQKAFAAFFETNDAVRKFGNSLSTVSPYLLDLARRHVQSVLSRVRERDILPAHGPGAVTTSKETWTKHYSTIETLFPYSDWFSLYFERNHCAEWDNTEYDDIIEAKLIAVPKDSRGPRLICVHPAEAVWIQQGLRCQLERAISQRRSAKGPWPQGHIFFDDQSVNGRIAQLSSKSRRYATLDMKEASDRISDLLVQYLFGEKYKWFGCCRAQRVYVPASGVSPKLSTWIHSYAPMGNATTFPVQSLVFWAICVASLQRHRFHQPGAVFVFGDDIIVPSEVAEVVINDLESFGLLVNRTKSFWRGAFRESCGVDAFNGVNVTPIRWKTTLDAEHLTGLQALSDLGMRLRISKYEEAATTVYSTLSTRMRRLGKQVFFTNNPNHGGIAEYSESDYLAWRDAFWHRDLQWYHSRVWRLEPNRLIAKGDHWNDLLESVVRLEAMGPSALSLARTGRSTISPRTPSRGFRLNRGWIEVR